LIQREKANERRLKTMNATMKRGVLAVTFLAFAAFAGPAVANSIHDEGDFGGGYAIIGPSGGPERYEYVRKHTFRPYYDGPAYSYYGPPPYAYSDEYGPEYYEGPGVVIGAPVVGY